MQHNRRIRTLMETSILLLFILFTLVAGRLIPESAILPDFSNTKLPPSLLHPFGTDWLGRDLFCRTLKGLSVSLTTGATVSLISAGIAIIIGVASVINNKILDSIVNWCIDFIMSVPHTVLILLISFALGKGWKGLLVGIATTHWAELARLIRGEVIQLRSRPYIAVSRRLGKSGGWILRHHLLPHLAPQFIVGLVLLFPHAILHEASISFLGYGLPPEQPAIGMILSESMRYLSAGMWWLAVCPGALLVGIVLLIDRIGENLRVLFDPYSAQK